MNSRNEQWMMRLKPIQVKYYSIFYWKSKKLQQYVVVNSLYFDQLQFFKQEWSVAPSIFNIKAQGLLAYCLLWMKLSQDEVYAIYF